MQETKFTYRKCLRIVCVSIYDSINQMGRHAFTIASFDELSELFEILKGEEVPVEMSLLEDSYHPKIQLIKLLIECLEKLQKSLVNLNALDEVQLLADYKEFKSIDSSVLKVEDEKEAWLEAQICMYSTIGLLFNEAYLLSNAILDLVQTDIQLFFVDEEQALALLNLTDQNVVLIVQALREIREVFVEFTDGEDW